jgi:hypothetical protein
MFVDPWHILDDIESNDDDKDEHLEGDDGIMEFDGLMNMKQNYLPMGAIVGFNDTINSSIPMEKAFAQLVATMQEITNECTEGDVTPCKHATSHMRVLACNICNIHLTKANAISHLRLMLHRIENGWEIVSNDSKIDMKQCFITRVYVLNDVMNKCLNY